MEGKLAAALITAHQGLKSPVHLGIPADVLRAASPQQTLSFPNLANLVNKAATACVVDMPAVAELWQLISDVLSQNQKVALFVGHECDGAVAEIMQFSELINAPIVTSLRGKAKVDPYHPLCKGVFGMAGHQTARRALTDESVGLILAVGTSLGQMGTSNWHPSLMNEKLVHIYPTNTYFPRSPMVRLQVCGTAGMIFQELTARLQAAQQQGKLCDIGFKCSAQEYEESATHAAHYLPPPQLEVRFPESYQNTVTSLNHNV